MAKGNTIVIVVLALIVLFFLGYLIYPANRAIAPEPDDPSSKTQPNPASTTGQTNTIPAIEEPTPSKSPAEIGCINSGGTVATSTCCLAAGDFPNSCTVGACGCALASSHQIKACSCPQGMCFSGTTCSTKQQTQSALYYCTGDNCATRKANSKIVALARDCYRNLSECQAAIPTGTIAIYCSNNNCSSQQIPLTTSMPPGCYHSLNDCQLSSQSATETSCQTDSDCVPAECCHPTSCINTRFKSVCNLFCTQECSGPLDCDAGSCQCINGKCAVKSSN